MCLEVCKRRQEERARRRNTVSIRFVHRCKDNVKSEEAHLHLDLALGDVHAHLESTFLDERRVDLDPVSLERGHAVRRDADLSSLRQAGRVVLRDGAERERVGISTGCGCRCLELGDRSSYDGGRELGRVDHDRVVVVVFFCAVGVHRGVGVCCVRRPSTRPRCNSSVERQPLNVVHRLVRRCRCSSRLRAQQVSRLGGGAGRLLFRLSLSLAL